MNSSINLKFYEQQYLEDLDKIQLTEEHLWFTSTPGEVIKTLQDPNRRMVLILNENVCVGYFVLHEKDGALDIGFDDRALLIRALAVNALEQGKGFAYQGMSMLPEFVKAHYPYIDKIVLIVNSKNVPAQRLYKKVGFVEHSSRIHETHGVQFIYRYDL
ncbi:MAG: GNAT family N-acetyltransferase [Oscillospiraceae bacterium]|nr:GNAT family N-acetyltransferase [Oscillospiraceae bacterium]